MGNLLNNIQAVQARHYEIDNQYIRLQVINQIGHGQPVRCFANYRKIRLDLQQSF